MAHVTWVAIRRSELEEQGHKIIMLKQTRKDTQSRGCQRHRQTNRQTNRQTTDRQTDDRRNCVAKKPNVTWYVRRKLAKANLKRST